VRSHAVIAARDTTDDQLDGFLVALAERAGREHGIGGKDSLQRSRSMGADGGKGVRYTANGLFDLRIDLGGSAGSGFKIGDGKTGHGDTPLLGLSNDRGVTVCAQRETLNVE